MELNFLIEKAFCLQYIQLVFNAQYSQGILRGFLWQNLCEPEPISDHPYLQAQAKRHLINFLCVDPIKFTLLFYPHALHIAINFNIHFTKDKLCCVLSKLTVIQVNLTGHFLLLRLSFTLCYKILKIWAFKILKSNANCFEVFLKKNCCCLREKYPGGFFQDSYKFFNYQILYIPCHFQISKHRPPIYSAFCWCLGPSTKSRTPKL